MQLLKLKYVNIVASQLEKIKMSVGDKEGV